MRARRNGRTREAMGATGPQSGLKMGWSLRPWLGLIVVFAFLGHDVVMTTPVSAMTAQGAAHAETGDPPVSHVVAPHSEGCQIGQVMVLEAPVQRLPQLATAFVAQLRMTRSGPVLPTSAVAGARSPTAQRAVLQIFRI
jgi:hypothetical protein